MKKIFNLSFIFTLLIVFVLNFIPISKTEAFTPLTLVSYDVSDTTISPNNDGMKDTVNIDVKYSEKVISDINFLDAQGNKIRGLYHNNAVTNPQSKIWDGKNDSNQIVPDGLYTIQILGTATADATNTISDTSKTITVDTTIPKTLSSIAITTPATKLNYIVGDALDINGLVVTGTYSDATTKIETITISNISGFNSATPATGQILTITDGAQTTTYTININTLPNPVSINLKIYAGDTVLFNGPKTVAACTESPETNAPITVNGKCAIEQSGLSNTWTWYDSNFHTVSDLPKTLGTLDELGGSASDNVNYIYWGWFSNLNYGTIALNKHLLSANEELLLTYNSFPLRISASKISGIIGDTITFTTEEKSTFSADFSDMIWTPSLGAIITLGAQSCTTIADGTCSFFLDTAGSLTAIGSKILYVPSASMGIEVSAPSGGGGGGYTSPTFDVQGALAYLKNVQSEDGSFGDSILYTDWAGIAFGSMNVTDNYHDKILVYLNSNNTISSLLTDNERHAMTLLALGQNPYSFNGVNYIDNIINAFDGNQFGDADLVNDDIFALIPLKNSGYTTNDDIITKDVSFIISKQKTNGSWEENVDITTAAIQALKPFESVTGVGDALTKAVNYLSSAQNNDGGWGNISSTSWAIQAMNAMSLSWIKDSHTGMGYLATQQTNANNNGALLPNTETLQNNIWATSYAIAAGSSKPWSTIMQTVSKPVVQSVGGGSSPVVVIPNNNTIPNEETIETTPDDIPNQETKEKEISPVDNPIVNKKTSPKSKETLASIKNLEINKNEINPETLTATALNSLPNQNIPNTIPIFLGVFSGGAILYFVRKFFFK